MNDYAHSSDGFWNEVLQDRIWGRFRERSTIATNITSMLDAISAELLERNSRLMARVSEMQLARRLATLQ